MFTPHGSFIKSEEWKSEQELNVNYWSIFFFLWSGSNESDNRCKNWKTSSINHSLLQSTFLNMLWLLYESFTVRLGFCEIHTEICTNTWTISEQLFNSWEKFQNNFKMKATVMCHQGLWQCLNYIHSFMVNILVYGFSNLIAFFIFHGDCLKWANHINHILQRLCF